MFKNDPIKIGRLKRQSNLWITPYMVKLMYEYDYVHAKVIRTKSDILFDQYRSPRKQSYKGKWIAYIYTYIYVYKGSFK